MTFTQRLLTGIRATGALHIGHFFGALQQILEYEAQYETFVMISDLQALNDNFHKSESISHHIREILADLYALNTQPTTTIFLESDIPYIGEMSLYLSNLISVNRILRNPTIKSEIASKQELFGKDGESVNLGLVLSPVTQTVNIAMVKAHVVPVGEDQLPFIEIGRDIVSKFNTMYKTDVFPLFEPKISRAPRILGLDGNAKMSKSLGNAIYVGDTPETTRLKIKKAKTDSLPTIFYDIERRPEISNLMLLYALVNNTDIAQVQTEVAGMQCGVFKEKLSECVNAYFAAFRDRREYAMQHPELLYAMLERGRDKVNPIVKSTRDEMKKVMGLQYL